jgi:hypothetical protein
MAALKEDVLDFIEALWTASRRDSGRDVDHDPVGGYLHRLRQHGNKLAIADTLPTYRLPKPAGAFSPARRALWLNRAALGSWLGDNQKRNDANEIVAFYNRNDFGRPVAGYLKTHAERWWEDAARRWPELPPRSLAVQGFERSIFWFGVRSLDEISAHVEAEPDAFPGISSADAATLDGLLRMTGEQRARLLQKRVSGVGDALTAAPRAERRNDEKTTGAPASLQVGNSRVIVPFDDNAYENLSRENATALAIVAAIYEVTSRTERADIRVVGNLFGLADTLARVDALKQTGWLSGEGQHVYLPEEQHQVAREAVLKDQPESFVEAVVDKVANDETLPCELREEVLRGFLVWVPQLSWGDGDRQSRAKNEVVRQRGIRIIRAILGMTPVEDRDANLLGRLASLGDLQGVLRYIDMTDPEDREYWAEHVLDHAKVRGDIEAVLDVIAKIPDMDVQESAYRSLQLAAVVAGTELPSRLITYVKSYPERVAVVREVVKRLRQVDWPNDAKDELTEALRL